MSRTYRVTYTEPCSECEGRGRFPNPDWIEFAEVWQAWEQDEGKDATIQEKNAKWDKVAGAMLGPRWTRVPEEFSCYEREGTGTLERQIDLEAALDELRNK